MVMSINLTKMKLVPALILSGITLINCTTVFADVAQKDLVEEQRVEVKPKDLVEPVLSSDEVRNLRLNSIREGVYAVALQKAANERMDAIMNYLESREVDLERKYDFSPFMLDNGRVLPAIITEAGNALNVVDNESAVSSITTYKIENDARIVSRPPTWRDYLTLTKQKVKKINPLLEPKNDEEQAAWDQAIKAGTKDGIETADQLYEDGVYRLTRDMAGAARFHRLLAQGIITKPTLAKGKKAVDVDGKVMTIGQTIYRLTEQVSYQGQSKWKVNSYTQTKQ